MCSTVCRHSKRWRNSQAEYLVCIHGLSAFILDYTTTSVSCYMATYWGLPVPEGNLQERWRETFDKGLEGFHKPCQKNCSAVGCCCTSSFTLLTLIGRMESPPIQLFTLLVPEDLSCCVVINTAKDWSYSSRKNSLASFFFLLFKNFLSHCQPPIQHLTLLNWICVKLLAYWPWIKWKIWVWKRQWLDLSYLKWKVFPLYNQWGAHGTKCGISKPDLTMCSSQPMQKQVPHGHRR